MTDPEPLPPEHPLWRTPGVLISPHVGGPSTAFFPRADRLIAAQLGRFAAGQELENIDHMTPLETPESQGIDPDCIFCKIISGELPSRQIYEDEHAVAFLDIACLAPWAHAWWSRNGMCPT